MKPDGDCLVTPDMAGKCHECGEYQGVESHWFSDRIWCADHCPFHNREYLEETETNTTTGEQISLWSQQSK